MNVAPVTNPQESASELPLITAFTLVFDDENSHEKVDLSSWLQQRQLRRFKYHSIEATQT